MMRIEHLPITGSEVVSHSLAASLRARAAAWYRTCVNYYAASAMYEDLAGLSDEELHRRGLSRDRLGRDAVDICTRED